MLLIVSIEILPDGMNLPNQVLWRLQNGVEENVAVMGMFRKEALADGQPFGNVKIPGAGVPLLNVGQHFLIAQGNALQVQIVLAFEIVIQQPLGYLTLGTDGVDGCAVIAFRSKFHNGCCQNPLFGALGFFLLFHIQPPL